eukprot:TRINITY_DN5582_c0_g1_i1.p1 TRINITY_DN5582_c0_g1~~TRINITY_DN5582_c0_g1_i1.p1  ORF type:complete len:127 (-),score=43.05 TRINITY_DN5582_c0_g1_i1:79-459(-)
MSNLSPIASPLAGSKLSKRIYKLTKRAAKEKAIKRGVKEVVKAIRKGAKGICIIAGDISPIDVITHVPVLCEESGILYCYVPAKDDLGSASLTKRPTSCVLVTKTEKNGDRFDKVKSELKALAKSS